MTPRKKINAYYALQSVWIFMPCRHANCYEVVAKIFKTLDNHALSVALILRICSLSSSIRVQYTSLIISFSYCYAVIVSVLT